MKKDYIQEAFHKQKIVTIANKRYCINALTDHSPITQPGLLEQISKEMTSNVNFKKADFLVGEEDRGGYICALMSYIWKKPFTLTKWNPAGLEGEISIDFRNMYTHGKLFLNGITDLHKKKAIIIEDIIDTGGTVIAMINLLKKNGVEILDVIAVAEKADYGGIERIVKETGIKPKVLVRFSSGHTHSRVTKRFI